MVSVTHNDPPTYSVQIHTIWIRKQNEELDITGMIRQEPSHLHEKQGKTQKHIPDMRSIYQLEDAQLPS